MVSTFFRSFRTAKLNSKYSVYIVSTFCTVLIVVFGSTYHYNSRSRKKNRMMNSEKEAVVSVNDKLHQRVDMKFRHTFND